MSTTLESAQAMSSANNVGLSAWMKRHALLAYFILAYGLAWLLWIPVLGLSQDGLGLLPFMPPVLPFVILGGFAPAAAAMIVTGVVEGRAGLSQFLRRLVQWRVGIKWYTLAALVPVLFLLVSILLSAIQPGELAQRWPLLFTFYPLVLPIQVLIGGGLGEEPGWRGFALPRLQARLGPLPAAAVLGVFHACWHIPLFFVQELGQAHFNFILFVFTGIAISVFLTWVYNNTGGALPIMMVLHEAEDSTSALALRIVPAYLNRMPAYALAYGAIALAILLFTRGRLGYRRKDVPAHIAGS